MNSLLFLLSALPLRGAFVALLPEEVGVAVADAVVVARHAVRPERVTIAVFGR